MNAGIVENYASAWTIQEMTKGFPAAQEGASEIDVQDPISGMSSS